MTDNQLRALTWASVYGAALGWAFLIGAYLCPAVWAMIERAVE